MTAEAAPPRVAAAAPQQQAVPVEGPQGATDTVRFRTSMGLPTGDAALAAAQDSSNASLQEFGLPLTDGELAELRLRQRLVGQDAARIRALVVDRFGTATLGGLWMDNLGGGVLTVAVTGGVAAVRQALEPLVSMPSRVAVVEAERSLAHLEGLAGNIRSWALADEVALDGISVDEPSNLVQVLTSDDPAAVTGWLASRGVPAREVEVSGTSATTVGTKNVDSPPFRGGQQIVSAARYSCTSGFIAHGAGITYVITAGHCGRAGSYWYQADTVPIGDSDRSDVSGTDAMRVRIDGFHGTNEVTLQQSNYTDYEHDYRAITSQQDSSNDAVGQVSCITGQNFLGLRCGEIVTRSMDVTMTAHDGRTVSYTGGREVDADCNPGDSGGPALYGNQARGILSAKLQRDWANDTCVYVHIEGALNQLGVSQVMTTPGSILV